MIEPVSVVRSARVPVVDIPQDPEPVILPARVVPSGPRSLAQGDGSLAGLRRPPSLAATPATAIPAALPSGLSHPEETYADPAVHDSHRLVHTPLPVVRLELQLLAQGEGSEALDTQAITSRGTGIGSQDRMALRHAVETLDAFPNVVFDEMLTIVQRLPLPTADAVAVVAAGLALNWLLAGPATSDPDERLGRLVQADVVDRPVFRQELVQSLRRLSIGLPVGSVIRVADHDLALRLNMPMSAEVAVMDTVVRALSDMLRSSKRSFHLLLLGGEPLPRPVACIRESDAVYSVFDPSCGVFTAAGDDLQAVIMGIAAEHEERLLQQRESEDLSRALAVFHDAQLMEVTMHGVDIDGDGVRDGGLI